MPEQDIKQVTRLTKEVYDALEKQLPKMAVTAETTAMQAGYHLGVQTVLRMLREGFVTA